MGRQIFVWREGLGVIPKDTAPPRRESGPYYVPDESPFISPIDFKTTIDGKVERKALERKHGITQVGTDQPRAAPKERFEQPDYVKADWV